MVDRENIKHKVVTFKENTQEAAGVKMALTPGKEYKVLSAKIITQTYANPACSNVLEYVVEDDNGERNMFPAFVFHKGSILQKEEAAATVSE